jgi:UDP-glucose 4-epimerase
LKLPSNKKILIFGASGQLGIDLHNELSTHQSKITFVRKLKWSKEHKTNKKNIFISVDLLKISEKKLKNLVDDADIIFHLSANTNVQVQPRHERNFLIPQINFLNRILVLLINTNKTLIFSSSCSVYGLNHKKIINDHAISEPLTSYDLLKTSSDQLIEYYQKIYNINCCSIRFSNIYGPAQTLSANKNRRILNKFIEQMHLRQEVAVVQNGMFYRNYLHVSDAARMLIYLAKQKRLEQSIYIGSSKENIFFVDAVKILAQKYEKKYKQTIRIKKNFPSNYITDTRSFKIHPSKIFMQGFKYKFNIEKGFSDLIKGEL